MINTYMHILLESKYIIYLFGFVIIVVHYEYLKDILPPTQSYPFHSRAAFRSNDCRRHNSNTYICSIFPIEYFRSLVLFAKRCLRHTYSMGIYKRPIGRIVNILNKCLFSLLNNMFTSRYYTWPALRTSGVFFFFIVYLYNRAERRIKKCMIIISAEWGLRHRILYI